MTLKVFLESIMDTVLPPLVIEMKSEIVVKLGEEVGLTYNQLIEQNLANIFRYIMLYKPKQIQELMAYICKETKIEVSSILDKVKSDLRNLLVLKLSTEENAEKALHYMAHVKKDQTNSKKSKSTENIYFEYLHSQFLSITEFLVKYFKDKYVSVSKKIEALNSFGIVVSKLETRLGSFHPIVTGIYKMVMEQDALKSVASKLCADFFKLLDIKSVIGPNLGNIIYF